NGLEIVSVAVELLNAMVAFVGYKDVACAIHGDSAWIVELAGARSLFAPLKVKLAIGFVPPNTIAPIRDIDVSAAINGYAGGSIKIIIVVAGGMPRKRGADDALTAPLVHEKGAVVRRR